MQVGVDQFEDFTRMKRFRQGANGAEPFRFVKDLWSTVCGNQKNRDVWLQVKNVGNDLKAGDVSEIEIDDAESKVLATHLIDPVHSTGNEHHFVTLRLEHQF